MATSERSGRSEREVPGEFKEIEDMRAASAGASVALDAGRAIDEPWFVARYLVKQAIKQFNANTKGRLPQRLHIPPLVEAALQVDAARNLDHHGKLRDEPLLFGYPVVWDAKEFRVE